MYALEHFNICSRCCETIPPIGCCVFCNYSEDEERLFISNEANQSPEVQRIKEEVEQEMKIFEAML